MKKILVILLVLSIIIGCQYVPGRTGKETAMPVGYRTGTQGLRISFVQNMPASRIFDNEGLDAVIEIENLGVADAGKPGDRVYLSGFDPNIITGLDITGKNIPLLKGKSSFIPKGELDRIHFKGIISSLDSKNIDKYPVRLLATACYEYETISSANICIDSDPYSLTAKQKVCTPKSTSLGSQGAPIAVKHVEVEPSPGLTRLKITIQNVGGGEVFRQGLAYLDKCSPYTQGFEYDEIGYIEVYDVNSGGMSIKSSCRPLDNGHVRLTGNTGIIYCELPTTGQAAYVSPLNIHLKYGYRNIIFKDIEILSVYS